MQEQMGKLTALLNDERRSHQHSCRALLGEADRRAERVRLQQQHEIEQLLQVHRSETSAVVALHAKTLEDDRLCAEERYALLEKDYDFLKSSFRTYKESICEEMRSSWVKKESIWKEEQEENLRECLRNAQELLDKSKQEKDQQRKTFEAEIAKCEEEIQTLGSELTEKDVTINLLRSSLHQTQQQLDTVTCQLSDLGPGVHRPGQKQVMELPPGSL
ncbi:flagellum-associated coiled-coil domain-containing protein 1-like [Osmerus eperlanus]|uniref:flagellum-associated coiled-coil domain-containing protein 1-like n=1 Tax=Osmerus eperlanus TaxID=29151 RepID=UPI002E0FFD36